LYNTTYRTHQLKQNDDSWYNTYGVKNILSKLANNQQKHSDSNLGSFMYAANCNEDDDFLAAGVLPLCTAPGRTSAVSLA